MSVAGSPARAHLPPRDARGAAIDLHAVQSLLDRIHAGVRHQLDEMVGLVPEQNPVKPRLRDLQHLSVYATSYRYTTPTGRIPDDPAPEAVEATANRIEGTLLEVTRRFGVDLDAADKPAANAAPIR